MSAVASFGNIINSLRSVRDEYNEHLKSVPQYEAFLLVESSTQKAADTLQGVISTTPAMAAEVVAALETAKAKFRDHLASVPEYRALLAIDKLINDVSADLGVTAGVEPIAPIQIAESPVEEMAAPAVPAAVEAIAPDQEAISQEAEIEPAIAETDAVVQAEPEQQFVA